MYEDSQNKEKPLDPESEIWTAKQSIISKELEHAVFHLGRALSADPKHPAALELLDELISDADSPLELAPLVEGVSYTTAAVHSYILAKTGAVPAALNLLLQVLRVRADAPYYYWLDSWTENQSADEHFVNPHLLHAFLAAWIENYPKFSDSDKWADLMIEVLPSALPTIMEHWLEDPPPTCLILGASVLRRVGEVDLAMDWANRAFDQAPSWQTAVGKAMIHAQREEIEEAIASYHQAMHMDPEDLSVLLDLGDLLAKHERFGEALRWYDSALTREPKHHWAYPSRLYVLWLQNGKNDYGLALKEFAEKNPDNDRANFLSERFQKQLSAFVDWLPAPTESILKVARRATESEAGSKLVSLSSSALEAPSALYAANWLLGLADLDPLPEITISKLQSPDPRETLGNVPFQLWTYHDNTPRSSMDKPIEAVVKIVTKLATEPYHLEAWWAYSRYEVETLLEQFDAATIAQNLLATMVHPPNLPSDLTPWHWLQRIQISAALLLGRVEFPEDGEPLDLEKSKLACLLKGPADWTVTAAILALAQVARSHKQTLDPVAKLFSERLQTIPDNGPVCYTYPLICNTLRLPGLSESTKTQLEIWKRDFLEPVF